MEHTKKPLILTIILIIIAIISSISFILSDTPDKVYLNPYYVDILAAIAGIFLITDGFISLKIKENSFFPIALRSSIGAAVITIHFWQFIFDLIR